MNGAAKSYRQEESHHSLNSCSEASGYSPGYHLDMNHPQHSKAMNFDNHSVNTYLFKHGDQYSQSKDYRYVNIRGKEDQRNQYKVPHRIPLELPVPKFEIDKNYVGEQIRSTSEVVLPKVENSSDLDLDTRINFLIKSKALAVMHPIFSQLESEESSCESDDPFGDRFLSKKKKRRTRSPSPLPVESVNQFDDPEIPLSRPPSPFLTRAKYLFWFNKAIELKKQARKQEQELLEKAAKKLLQENSTSGSKTDKDTRNREIIPLPKNVLDEVCSELKEIVKSEFIKEVFEDAVFNTLEKWWESNCHKKSAVNIFTTSTIHSTNEIACLKGIKSDGIRITEEAKKVCNSQMEIEQKIINLNALVTITDEISDNKDSADVEGQCLSSSNTTVSVEYSVPNTTSYHEENENNAFMEESAYGNEFSFNRNAIARINQTILDESTLFLPFPNSLEVPEILTQRLEKNDNEKNQIVLNVLDTILENVFQHIKI